ncbi:MAG: Uma2 family endonuclease [Acidobacteriota bacterium]|nr:Uma2 family endonuclease [Acidobacteriota bacterium]
MFLPVDEYLATSYDPRCEYINGKLIAKPAATWEHGILQAWIASLILKLFPRLVVGSEVRAHLRSCASKFYRRRTGSARRSRNASVTTIGEFPTANPSMPSRSSGLEKSSFP